MADYIDGIDEFNQLEQNTVLLDLLKHIEERIILFANSHTYEKIMVKKKNETQHSTALSLFMMKGQNKFAFMNEVAQKGNHKIDIGIFDQDTDNLIFTIEAKVLPMPEPKKIGKSRDEHEYVYRNIGTGAGIERFKRGEHGLDTNNNLLLDNGMIAYIKDHDFAHWHTQINQWIMDAGWGESEKLKPKYPNQPDKYISEHQRGENDSVKLHHFWVQVAHHHIPTNPKVCS